jgi:hypothetical protein
MDDGLRITIRKQGQENIVTRKEIEAAAANF